MQRDAWYFQKDIVKGYESFYQQKYRRADRSEKALLKRLLDHLEETESLLEVGCGTSHFTRWFESLGLECVGLDLSDLMLREAKKLWTKGTLLQGESSLMPFRSKSFDVVAFIACLVYMPDPIKVIREAARVARRGIIFGLINRWSLPTVRRMIQVKMGKNPYYRNAKFYSILDIKQTLHEALGDAYKIPYWNTAVFPNNLEETKSSLLPFGAFLGVAVKLR
jgi:ubiquinone/menaquinone biosynthesis C-methylase UbiE